MKKVLMFLVLATVVCSLVFTLHETWFSMGYEQAFFMDSNIIQGNTLDTNTVSRGVNLSTYRFLRDNIGIFVHGSFLFPKNSWVWDNNGITNIDFTDYGINMQLGFIIGFAYKINFTNDFKSYFGIGINYLTDWAVYPGIGSTSYGRDRNSFGISGDLGLKFDLTDRFFIKTGSILVFDFARYTTLETYSGRSHADTSSGWDKDFFMISARPYISAGINFYWRTENDRLRLTSGKPN